MGSHNKNRPTTARFRRPNTAFFLFITPPPRCSPHNVSRISAGRSMSSIRRRSRPNQTASDQPDPDIRDSISDAPRLPNSCARRIGRRVVEFASGRPDTRITSPAHLPMTKRRADGRVATRHLQIRRHRYFGGLQRFWRPHLQFHKEPRPDQPYQHSGPRRRK